MRILVTGGTGVVGRHVVLTALARGHEVVAASRGGGSPDPRATGRRVDLGTGDGLAAALDGVDTVIDCAHVQTTNAAKAVRWFTEATTRLTNAAKAAGVRHLVVLSIVGIDRIPLGYYKGKLAQEKVALEGPVPATVVRATQFHEFAGQMLDRMRLGPVHLMPAMRVQPIAAAEVATALVDLAEGPATGRADDIGGPSEEYLPDLARAVLKKRGGRGLLIPLPIPGAAGRAGRAGAGLVPDPSGQRGPSFADWLAH
ncbi:3-beta hydroxysteroid dehydrogenase [Virgisporangium aliadipatigenens]|uniref:3-beta hydroxysteroid dehydrogenase n=1 Tax=Virgisporangium aliadipatigenens TaxID=741659 RepID=A0A8J4DRK9_9ACTN|nr:NAD(P)H-binding protein [Virgisporangium aliadipatigenens]GIJ47171.1 3-beta hydroxysteroid dehydrogenase [Virgisporangium aliadipatigenens]